MMRCKRCDGLMIVELSVEEELEEQVAQRGALRCINCGAMVNVRILRNLAARETEKGVSPGRPHDRRFLGATLGMHKEKKGLRPVGAREIRMG